MKQTGKHSVRIEHEKFWKHLFHLLQVLKALQGIILELSRQKTIRLCETMTFCGTYCQNIGGIKIF